MLTRFRSKNSKSVGQKGGWNRSRGFPLLAKKALSRHATGLRHSVTPGKLAPGEHGLDIDIRRFQGVFFDKGATWFNRITHQGGEQLIGSNGILDGDAACGGCPDPWWSPTADPGSSRPDLYSAG